MIKFTHVTFMYYSCNILLSLVVCITYFHSSFVKIRPGGSCHLFLKPLFAKKPFGMSECKHSAKLPSALRVILLFCPHSKGQFTRHITQCENSLRSSTTVEASVTYWGHQLTGGWGGV